MKKLDHTSEKIIRNILGRIHCASPLEEAEKAVFKKIKGFETLPKKHKTIIKDFIKKAHQENFIVFAMVMGGQIK